MTEAVERALGRGDFLLRYTNADGLEGEEGAFLNFLSSKKSRLE